MAPTTEATAIQNPRRCLVLSEPNHDLAKLNTLLPSTSSESCSESTDPATECLHIANNYYTASVPIWRDVITDLTSWEQEFCQPEAAEVVRAVGAWVYCFEISPASHAQDANTDADADTDKLPGIRIAETEARLRRVLESLNKVIARACGPLEDWEGVRLVILDAGALKPVDTELFTQLEDLSLALGFEIVDINATGQDEFGGLCGLDRAREVLEANNWNLAPVSAAADMDAFGEFVDGDMSDEADLLGLQDATASLLVEDLDRLMSGAMAIRGETRSFLFSHCRSMALSWTEQGSHLPMEQRKTFAAEAIRELMKNSQ